MALIETIARSPKLIMEMFIRTRERWRTTGRPESCLHLVGPEYGGRLALCGGTWQELKRRDRSGGNGRVRDVSVTEATHVRRDWTRRGRDAFRQETYDQLRSRKMRRLGRVHAHRCVPATRRARWPGVDRRPGPRRRASGLARAASGGGWGPRATHLIFRQAPARHSADGLAHAT